MLVYERDRARFGDLQLRMGLLLAREYVDCSLGAVKCVLIDHIFIQFRQIR